MSAYLTAAEDAKYVSAAVTLTDALILQASAIIDGYCKRTLEVKSYTERIRLSEPPPGQYVAGHLSYFPVVSVDSAKGRPKYNLMTGAFFGPPAFEDIADLNVLDVNKGNGSLMCGFNLFGVPFTELEITYRSGFATIPDTVKVACGMIITQLTANANPNVKAKKDFDLSIEYFGNRLITPEIAGLLSDYVLHTFR